MKRFITHILLFSFLPFVMVALSIYFADGSTDAFYLRFTTPRQSSLILGGSRAAQGLMPDIIDSILNIGGYNTKLFNYSFTGGQSPYGPVYYKSIQKKLNENGNNGVFILSVDPWSLSSIKNNPNDSTLFKEKNLCVGKTNFVTMDPNVEYLIESYQDPLFNIAINKMVKELWHKKGPSLMLHKNGWIEVNINMNPAAVQKRILKTIQTYKKNSFPQMEFSTLRYTYLKKTITFLKTHGTVYLVRLPMCNGMRELENNYIPYFDSLMTDLSIRNNISYFNFVSNSDEYDYTDGNHLYKTSAEKLSKKIGYLILQSKKENAYKLSTKLRGE